MSREILTRPPPPADLRIFYGPDASHFGDLRLPPGEEPRPVVVLVHGGFWRADRTLDYFGHGAAALTALGFATWNLEFRRVGGGGGWPETFLDVARGVDHLRTLALFHPLDADRVIVVGHSSGGHLALWLAGRGRVPPGDPLYASHPLALRGAVSLGGICDLTSVATRQFGDGAVLALMGGKPTAHPERYASADPAAMVPLGTRHVLIHGAIDDRVPLAHCEPYVRKARAAGDNVELVALEGVDHFEVVDPEAEAWKSVVAVVQRLFG